MPTFLHILDDLKIGPWGLKGDALVRTAKSGLPIAPGFLLNPREDADLPAAIKTLEGVTARTFGAQENGFFLYVRVLPFDLKEKQIYLELE